MSLHDKAEPEHGERHDARQAGKPVKKIAWYWLIVVLVIGFRLGMDVQHRLDKRVMDIMNETIDGCVDVMERLHGKDPDKPTLWVYIAPEDRTA